MAEVRRHVPRARCWALREETWRRSSPSSAWSPSEQASTWRSASRTRRARKREELLDEAGVSVAGLAGCRNLVAPDPAIRTANIDYIARCLELATSLGTWVVATETGTRPLRRLDRLAGQLGKQRRGLVDDALDQLLPVWSRRA